MTPFTAKYQLRRNLRPFTRREVRGLERDRLGLYALWLPAASEDTPECLYVGMSGTSVRRRLLDHLNNEDNPELRREFRLFGRPPTQIRFSVTFTENEAETRELETAVIADWQPRTNRRGV